MSSTHIPKVMLSFLTFSFLLFSSTNVLTGQLALNELETVTLVNGMQIPGRVGSIPKIGATLANLSADSKNHGITLIDDDLRRVFVSRFNIANRAPLDRLEEHFEIWQKVDNEGSANSEIGQILAIGPFDEFGRRPIRLQTARGPKTYMQGITEVTPRYCKVEGISEPGLNGPKWDMRIATSSVPTEVLAKILYKQIRDPDNADERRRLVEFFAQAEKFRQAETELRSVVNDFPGLTNELGQQSKLLVGRIARQALDEARMRQQAGQPIIASQMIKSLEGSVGIATAILVEINEVKKELSTEYRKAKESFDQVSAVTKRVLETGEIDGNLKATIESFQEDVKNNLRSSNVDRLATFMRFYDDPDQDDERKLALAISGWVVGSGSAINRLGEAQSLVDAQALVREYLQTQRGERRQEIIELLRQLEGGTPEQIAKIIAHLTPPLAPSPSEIPVDAPMEFTIKIPGTADEQARYLVQLPPEYDPYRRYPCILTLAGETPNTTPEAQIQWWCGRYHSGLKTRMGQASRQGFIVVAPDWRTQRQRSYGYSAREHAVVLKSLREAMRRFSIDSDRVFLTGHFSGADAAWDIGQSHPEHWAGVIPISARAQKYIGHYYSNAKFQVPFYFVNGSRDFRSLEENAKIWNRQFSKDYDVMIVQYIGRGSEKFSDEIHNLFRWMRPIRRRFDVRKFECASMRPWDNYFWWFEVDLTTNQHMIYPAADWSKQQRSRWRINGEIKDNVPNRFILRGASGDFTLWLLPELVDFSLNVQIGGASDKGGFNGPVQPSRKVILEDVRTRGDRQHPYWAKIQRFNKSWIVEKSNQ